MFNKIISIILIITCCLMFIGCGSDRTINLEGKNHKYSQYGLINQNEMKNDKIKYRVIVGNVIWSIVLVETVVAPVILLGFYLFEPVGIDDGLDKGVIE